MNCYVINLDRATDRLAFQKEQFARFGLKFERVPACVDDPAAVNRFRWWCAVLRPRVRGEVGCALSHAKVFKLMQTRKEPCAAVFEDDVVFSVRVAEALRLAEEVCIKNPRSVVLLGDHKSTKSGEALAGSGDELAVVEETWNFCSEGYVIGWEAAKNLAKVQSRVRTPFDAWYYYRKKGWIRLFRVSPSICGQATDNFPSSLGSRYVIEGKGRIAWTWWKLRRVVGVLLDGILDGGKFVC